jgi:predicted DNA-binding transcriptional regulator YafY
MVEEITRYAADVIVLEPLELREAVLESLRRVAALAPAAV